MTYRHRYDDAEDEFPWLVLDDDEPVASFDTEQGAIDWIDATNRILHRDNPPPAAEGTDATS